MVVFKRAAKELDINCRHSGALTGHDRYARRILFRILEYLRDQLVLQNGNPAGRKRIWRMTKSCVRKLLSIISIPQLVVVNYNGDRLRINSEVIQDAMIPVTYRFKNRSQLWELHDNLQIPQWFIIPLGGHRIHGQEMLLMALERCALGSRLIDMQQKYHIYHSVIGKALHYFALWMQDNWGYLSTTTTNSGCHILGHLAKQFEISSLITMMLRLTRLGMVKTASESHNSLTVLSFQVAELGGGP